ncbi:MAG: 3-deoxy-manno-octulosonate cytidylyltransferase (CMP-KDO synthetase) [Candidatus Deianiraeaceae bacterium]|jgi:3-deoxy-manno-octulosonate cytidylyltransferase (CMP-KDO synthetase)
MKTAIIIPSRIDSTRLPRKALAMINGKTLIQHCYESAVVAKCGDVFVATDNDEIAHIIQSCGGKTFMTPSHLPSGTDRVWNAYKQIGSEYDCIVNLQGDVPNIHPQIIQQVIDTLKNTGGDISTATIKINKEIAQDASCVKPVVAKNGRALYFSRQPIPYGVDEYFEHIGIYAYTPQSLEKFINLEESPLEKLEKLEQLRALENDMSIYVTIVDFADKPINIDTQSNLNYARKILKQQPKERELRSTEKYKQIADSLRQNMKRRKK